MGLGGSDGGEGVAAAWTRAVVVGIPIGLESTIGRSRVQPWLRTHQTQARSKPNPNPEAAAVTIKPLIDLLLRPPCLLLLSTNRFN